MDNDLVHRPDDLPCACSPVGQCLLHYGRVRQPYHTRKAAEAERARERRQAEEDSA